MRASLLRPAVVIASLLAFAPDANSQTLTSLSPEMHWRHIGPYRAGRARALAGVPSQPNTFNIGFDNGGVWRSTDFGSNCETYVKGSFVELESLGPLQHLEPGASTEYVEHWYLFPDVEIGATEATTDAALQPLLPKTVPR